MGIPNPTAQQFYDLTLLGLTWVRQEESRVKGHMCGTVLRVMCRAGVFSGTVRQGLKTNWRLPTLAMENARFIYDRRPPTRTTLETLIATTEKHLVIHVPHAAPVIYANLFGRGGYRCFITEHGIGYAEGVRSDYERYIDASQFMSLWGQDARQMRAIHAARTHGDET